MGPGSPAGCAPMRWAPRHGLASPAPRDLHSPSGHPMGSRPRRRAPTPRRPSFRSGGSAHPARPRGPLRSPILHAAEFQQGLAINADASLADAASLDLALGDHPADRVRIQLVVLASLLDGHPSRQFLIAHPAAWLSVLGISRLYGILHDTRHRCGGLALTHPFIFQFLDDGIVRDTAVHGQDDVRLQRERVIDVAVGDSPVFRQFRYPKKSARVACAADVAIRAPETAAVRTMVVGPTIFISPQTSRSANSQ